MDPKRLEKLQAIQDWELSKPSTDEAWVEDVKAESLHVKYDFQLEEMLESHVAKIPKVEKDLDISTNWPQVKRYELNQQFTQMFEDQENPADIEGKTLQQWIDEEFDSQNLYYTWKKAKLEQSVLRIAKEIELRSSGFLDVQDEIKIEPTDPKRVDIDKEGSKVRSPIGTTYYIDATNGSAANNGLAIGTAYLDLDNFTEVARSAGDKAILRRGLADKYDNGTDLNFTSDGTMVNPITIEADFDNAFSDQVDLSATATATLTFGSKTVTFSADISSVLVAGDWIYASGDSNKEFAYEVASVVTTTVTLYLPYKGNQAGSGKTMYNMQDNPIWNIVTGDFQWNFDTDNYWKVQGIDIRGTDINGELEIDSCIYHQFIDCIFQASGASEIGVLFADDNVEVRFNKCRFTQNSSGDLKIAVDVWGHVYLTDCLLTSLIGFVEAETIPLNGRFYLKETEYDNNFGKVIDQFDHTGVSTEFYLQNFLYNNTLITSTAASNTKISSEDHGGVVGDNRIYEGGENRGSNQNAILYQSETTTVRSGGSNKSIKVIPTTKLNTKWNFGKLLLFEIPIYATTDSKQYDIYFRPNTTAEWTTDPTASELWIELEAWGHATNNFRKITKSTGVIDMNGSTAWQALSVTVAPAQVGVAYLRVFYCKTKEAGANVFFCDPVPIIT